ncbi:YdbH domain-containing protein [Shewanella sp. 0m-4]
MQQAGLKSWRHKAARYTGILLLTIVTLAAILGGVVLCNYERVTIDLANQFLAPYNTQINQLSFNPKSLTHWHVSSTELTVDSTDIKITDLNILFDKKTKPWALKVSDLLALSVEEIDVKLALNALSVSRQTDNEAGPTIGLNFDAFPDIELTQTRIALQGAKANAPIIELNNLSLNKQGELKSQIVLDNQPLLSLSAKLTTEQWRATSSIDLTLLQSFSRRLAATEKMLYAKQAKTHHSAQPTSLLSPLYRLTQSIDDKNISFDATLDSTLKLDLTTAILTSEHSLRGTKLVLYNLADVTLQPVSYNLSAEQQSQESLGTLNFDITGHIGTPILTVMPFKLPLSLEQHEQLLHLLNDKPFEQALSNLYQELSYNTLNKHKGLSLLLSVDEGLSYQIGQPSPAAPQLKIPALSLSIKDSRLDAKIFVSQLGYQLLGSNSVSTATSTAGDYRLSADWQLEVKHDQSITLNQLWPKLRELPYQIKIGKASLTMQGEMTAAKSNQQTSYSIKVASNAAQITNGITIVSPKLAVNAGSALDATPQAISQAKPAVLSSHIEQTKLSINSPIEYRYQQGVTHFTFPALSYQVTGIDGDLQLSNTREEQYKLRLDHLDFALKQPMPLTFTTANASNNESANYKNSNAKNLSFTRELLTQQLHNQISLTLTQLSLDKSGYSPVSQTKNNNANQLNQRRIKQKLVQLDTVELSQQLTLNQQRLSSDENWQINDLFFTSQHQFVPQLSNLTRFNLSGDWQFSSKFAPILAFLSQTDSLPDTLDIQGNTELVMHYQLKKNQQLAFNMVIDPKVNDIKGSLYNLPFDGGNMDTQCQYRWQQNSAKKHASSFACDNIKLSLLAFNPGVMITDIKAEAAVSFSTGSDVAPQPTSTNSKQNLALAQLLLGVKQASVRLTAQGDLLGGQLLIPQFQLNLRKPSSAYFVLQHIDLTKVLAIHPLVGISADGIFDGVLPVSIEKGKASISGGRLAARPPGGYIAIGNNPAVEKMRQSQPYLEFAFSALEHLNYSELSSSFDMDAQGDAKLKVNVKGRSQGIERPIHFNYSQEENMIQLLRSLQIGDNLQNQIERAVK